MFGFYETICYTLNLAFARFNNTENGKKRKLLNNNYTVTILHKHCTSQMNIGVQQLAFGMYRKPSAL